MTPERVEATMMAFATSCMNLSAGGLPEILGLTINKWFLGISEDDLSNYYLVPVILLFATLYEIMIIRFIPLMKDIQQDI